MFYIKNQMDIQFNDETKRILKRLKTLQEENEKFSLKCTQLYNATLRVAKTISI